MKKLLTAAGIRALRTAIQTFLATVGTTTIISEINWPMVLSTTALSSVISFLMGILSGLPEVP